MSGADPKSVRKSAFTPGFLWRIPAFSHRHCAMKSLKFWGQIQAISSCLNSSSRWKPRYIRIMQNQKLCKFLYYYGGWWWFFGYGGVQILKHWTSFLQRWERIPACKKWNEAYSGGLKMWWGNGLQRRWGGDFWRVKFYKDRRKSIQSHRVSLPGCQVLCHCFVKFLCWFMLFERQRHPRNHLLIGKMIVGFIKNLMTTKVNLLPVFSSWFLHVHKNLLWKQLGCRFYGGSVC